MTNSFAGIPALGSIAPLIQTPTYINGSKCSPWRGNERVLYKYQHNGSSQRQILFNPPSKSLQHFGSLLICAQAQCAYYIKFNLILKFEASDIELWKLDLGMRICNY